MCLSACLPARLPACLTLARGACTFTYSIHESLVLASLHAHGTQRHDYDGGNKQVQFIQEQGLDYTSCSPFRVPIARIAAAQAAIRTQQQQQEEEEGKA